MSTAGDILRTANAGSAAFPPLQAALSLVSYIDESIALFKSNGNEIKAIGEYSRRLSELLLNLSVNPTSTCNMIDTILAYVQKVSTKRTTIQYLKRRHIGEKLQGFRSNLWEEFAVFSLASDIEVQTFQKAAELAREEDTVATQAAFKQLSLDIRTASVGVQNLAESLGLTRSEFDRKEALVELQAITDGPGNADEATVLRESLRLTTAAVLLPPNYDWFSQTFNAPGFSPSEAVNILADGISDVIYDLNFNKLLTSKTVTALNHERSGVTQTEILFRILNARQRDVILVRTFQRSVARRFNMHGLLREDLDLE